MAEACGIGVVVELRPSVVIVDAGLQVAGLSPDTPRDRNLTGLFSGRDQPSSECQGFEWNVLEVD